MPEGAVRDDADAVRRAPRQLAALDVATHQVVPRLVRVDGGHRPGRLEVGQVVVRHADRPDLALGAQVDERADRLLRGHAADRPVHLVEVDRLHAEGGEAALERHPQVLGGGLPPDAQAGVADLPRDPALRGDDHVVPPVPDDLPDDPLGAPLAVDVGGVDPVDPRVERGVAGRLGVGVLGPAPAPAEHPGAESDDGQLEVGPAQSPSLHAQLPRRVPAGRYS